jgi:hypothetical protein
MNVGRETLTEDEKAISRNGRYGILQNIEKIENCEIMSPFCGLQT